MASKVPSPIPTSLLVAIFLLACGLYTVQVRTSQIEKELGTVEANDINTAQTIESITAQLPPTVPAQANDETIKDVCWDGDPEMCHADAWAYRTLIDGQVYTIRLGESDADGEVRHLDIRNSSGTVEQTGPLPKTLTYTAGFSDFDGSPYNHSPDQLSQNGIFEIEVYLPLPILAVEGYRLPVLVKQIAVPDDLR